MNTLYLRLPSSAGIKTVQVDSSLPCSFALASHQGVIARSGETRLSSLAATMADADRVVLLLAAADVTLLAIRIPPLSPARLKRALPNLVEEHLLDDPENCVIVPGTASGDLLTVAVMLRDRLQSLADICLAMGARKLQAWPLQSCLSQHDRAMAVLHEYTNESGSDSQGVLLELGLHLPGQSSLGLSLHAADAADAAQQAISTLRLLQPTGPVTLLVPPQHAPFWIQIADADMDVQTDDWKRWIAANSSADRATPPHGINMMRALAISHSRFDLRAWRLPLQLAAAVLLINTIALNADWWRMHREAETLKAGMLQTYRSRFPNERVILDPLLQMQQKIAIARRASGEPAPDDFLALSASLASAWNGLPPTSDSNGAIASLDYRERSLSLKLKPQVQQDEQFDAFQQQLQTALAERRLTLQQGAADSWQIRRAP
ncbi:MAG TPA: type II secretion system protein GspL [Oxalicibacterium sp.]|uniref:type II secretion system protein GspL n=1 Tax=Oxalicibacterium sp. TaxID=2766525 RepID=UPI002C320606|nr:type II secretion system protein GspL [Oxalicibacterium sp.]HWU97064.1 type II secretion system protein GspL [Oxalicibacterium sp.]